MECKDMLTLYTGYYGWLWHGDIRSQGISSHGADLIIQHQTDAWQTHYGGWFLSNTYSFNLQNIPWNMPMVWLCFVLLWSSVLHGLCGSFTYFMMTSSNGNIFHITGPLWGESTSHRWSPFTKASDAELWCFLSSAHEQTVEQTTETPMTWDAIMLIMKSL